MKNFVWSSAALIAILIFTLATAETKVKKEKIETGFITTAKIFDIHDGDTVTVLIEKKIRVRLLDCWSPELSEKKGIEAREYLKTLIKDGDEVTVKIPVEMDITKSLTFGRFLGTIYKDIDNDGQEENISEEMVKAGHATKAKVQ